MIYYLFYIDFVLCIFFEVIVAIFLILSCLNIKLNNQWDSRKLIKSVIFAVLFIIIVFTWSIPSLKDYFNIKHNNFSVVEGTITSKIHPSNSFNYYVTINNYDLRITGNDYENIMQNKNYKITYLPNTKIAIKIEAK